MQSFPSGNDRTTKKCYVCKKPGCWSREHTDEERAAAYGRIKQQLTTELDMSSDEVQAFLAEFEGQLWEEEDEFRTKMEELPEEDVSEIYLIELSEINGTKAISILND